MATFPDIGTTFTVRNLGESALTIGNGGDFIVANASDITVTTSQCIETGDTRMRMSRGIYREDLRIDARHIQSPEYHRLVEETINQRLQQFDRTTSFAATASSWTYTTSSYETSSPWMTDTMWHYPEEVMFYNPEPISATTASDGYRWYVYGEGGIWSIEDVTCRSLTQTEVMQQKIDEAWALYCRNENHAKEMQKKIANEWGTHLQQEQIAEAERIRLLPEKKANKLMSMLIGEEEHRVYEKTGRVFVKGKNGLYMVKRGGGISKIEGNNITDFCVHIHHGYNCPPTDHAIALKTLLEDDDRKVIKMANFVSKREVKELPLAACM